MTLESTQRPEAVPEGHVLAISGPHVVQSDWDWSQIIGFSLGINSYITLLALKSTQVPGWPSLGRFRPPRGQRWLDWTQIIGYSLGINSYYKLLALQSTQGPKGGQGGQVWAISGPLVLRGGWD